MSEATETIFSVGASRHRWKWLRCNELAVKAAREAGVNPYDPKIKLMLALTVLKVLNHLYPENKPMMNLAKENKFFNKWDAPHDD